MVEPIGDIVEVGAGREVSVSGVMCSTDGVVAIDVFSGNFISVWSEAPDGAATVQLI